MQLRRWTAGAVGAGAFLLLASASAFAGTTETTAPSADPALTSETPADSVVDDVKATTDSVVDDVEATTDSVVDDVEATTDEVTDEVEAELSELGECLHEADQAGTDPEECQQAPNPILPATNEILWGFGAFLVLLVIMWKFALPPVRQGMADRTERIRSDLERAETAKAQSEAVLAEYQAQLADAKTEATRIIEDARQTADAVKADLQARAEAEIADMRRRAAADVEAAKAQAIADLTAEVATLAIGAAEVVVQRNLDRDTQVQLVENYISQVGGDALMTTQRADVYAEALLRVAAAEGQLGEVEDELFRFAQALDNNDNLREALTDPHIPASRRQQIVEDLLEGKATPISIALISMVVGTGRGNDLQAIIHSLVELSARQAHKEVAHVRSAIDLTDDQRQRLAAALANALGQEVEVKVVVDPTVLGGLVTQVGDTVIDGSVRHRLAQLRESF